MAFSAPVDSLLRMAETIDYGLMYAINANISEKDNRTWEMWETVYLAHGTSPLLRSAADAHANPGRNSPVSGVDDAPLCDMPLSHGGGGIHQTAVGAGIPLA